MTLADRYACRGCRRRFLSERALVRHHERNPGHAMWVFTDEPSGSGEWVAFEDRLETFRVLPEGATAADLDVSHTDRTVRIVGVHEERIDAPAGAGTLSWRVRDGFLVLSFDRRETP